MFTLQKNSTQLKFLKNGVAIFLKKNGKKKFFYLDPLDLAELKNKPRMRWTFSQILMLLLKSSGAFVQRLVFVHQFSEATVILITRNRFHCCPQSRRQLYLSLGLYRLFYFTFYLKKLAMQYRLVLHSDCKKELND